MCFLACALAVLAVGCGGNGDEAGAPASSSPTGVGTTPAEPDQEPEEFFETLFGFYFDGRYGRAWELLHPAHRAVVPRSRFAECVGSLLENTSIVLEDVEVLEVEDRPIDVPEIPEERSTAVTLRLTVTNAFGAAERNTNTYDLINVGGQWAWILEPTDVAAYERGACPT